MKKINLSKSEKSVKVGDSRMETVIGFMFTNYLSKYISVCIQKYTSFKL